ncbi:MAG TPA: hypothetical protein VMU50_19040 [Polyangia bacterium]|nr:hypothetical protein [Polyangia bacterium]
MTTFQPIGLRLFDANTLFARRSSPAGQPLDGLRALSRTLGQPAQSVQTDSGALPDFLSAAAASLSALRGAGVASQSGAFTLTTSAPDALNVTSLASAAHARSAGFTSPDDEVTAGTLALSTGGRTYNVAINQGEKLKDVVAGIRASGAPVDAALVADPNQAGQLRLSVTTRATGYDASGSAADALTIDETDAGTTGKALGLIVDHQATNAQFTLHGVLQSSRNDLITDDITGGTIDLANPALNGSAAGAASALGSGGAGGGDGALVSVDSVAQAGEVRSGVFGSESAQVKAGTLSLTVEGKRFDVAVNSGDTLADVRRNVENSGAGVRATLVKDGGGVRLAIAARETGYAIGGRPQDALSVTETSTGDSGQALSPEVTQAASNARVTVNGTVIESRGNTISNAIPGFTLNARHVSAAPEVVSLPGGGLRAPLNVENELNRVLQAQLLKPRDLGFAGDSNDSAKDDVKQLGDPTKTTPARRPATGGNESSRRDIMQKLTAVDDIFSGLKATQALLASGGGATDSAAVSGSAAPG